MNYTFTLDLSVHDARALHAAACAHYMHETPSADDCEETFGTPDQPNIPACLSQLLDPGCLDGCNIHSGDAERGTA